MLLPNRGLTATLRECWIISGNNGKQHAKNSSLANSTLDFDSAVMSFNNSFALEHSDAYAFLFGRLKGSKEGMSNELWSHAAAVIAD